MWHLLIGQHSRGLTVRTLIDWVVELGPSCSRFTKPFNTALRDGAISIFSYGSRGSPLPSAAPVDNVHCREPRHKPSPCLREQQLNSLLNAKAPFRPYKFVSQDEVLGAAIAQPPKALSGYS